MSSKTLTTAEVIGKFYKELIAEGIRDELAEEITAHAAKNLISDDGFGVKA